MKKFIIPALLCFVVQFGFAQKATDMSTPKISPNGTINYAVMENAPQFKGCENAGSKQQKGRCTTEKIEAFIQDAFNENIARTLSNNITADDSVYIRFVINKQGMIENVGARTDNLTLKKEVVRILKTLPAFTIGKYRGTPINVTYGVTFQTNRLIKKRS